MTTGLDQMKPPNKMSAQNNKKKKKKHSNSLPTILVLYIMCVGQLNKNIEQPSHQSSGIQNSRNY